MWLNMVLSRQKLQPGLALAIHTLAKHRKKTTSSICVEFFAIFHIKILTCGKKQHIPP